MAYTGPYPHTNTGTTSAIVVSGGTSFNGTVGNTGTITPGWTTSPTPPAGYTGDGIAVLDNSTINGHIGNAGVIIVSGTGIVVGGFAASNDSSTVTSGIINGSGGKINAGDEGILVANESQFHGGVTNLGLVKAGSTGLNIFIVSTFAGGVTNTGTITAHYDGITVQAISTFSGNVTNTGTISSGHGAGIFFRSNNNTSAATYSGTIGNSGVISSYFTGISVQSSAASGFSGAVTNSGKITATTREGIYVHRVADTTSGSIGGRSPATSSTPAPA